MVIRTGVMILVAVLVCCSTQAQSILLDRGERGLFLQGGYIGGSEGGDGGKLDLGYAISSRFDMGLGVALINQSRLSGWGGYGPLFSSRVEVGLGPLLDFYPIRFGNADIAAAIGLHDAVTFKTRGDGTSVNTASASLNLLLHTNANNGFLFWGGGAAASMSGYSEKVYSGFIGMSPFVKMANSHRISVVFEYGFSDESNTFAGGLTWCFTEPG